MRKARLRDHCLTVVARYRRTAFPSRAREQAGGSKNAGMNPGLQARVAAPRRILFLMGAAMAAATLAFCADAPPSDPIIQAMRDEVDRSVKLNLPNLEEPYFVQYLLDQSDSFTVSASLGALLARSRDHFRVPEVEVRVGDYKFDNTNFAGGGGGGSRYDLGNFPLDDDYAVLRRYLWLGTDSVYKGAVEAISRKRAAMRNINQADQLDDFAHAVPVHLVQPFQKLTLDEKTWVSTTRGGRHQRAAQPARPGHDRPFAGLQGGAGHGAGVRRHDAARFGDLPRSGRGPSAFGRGNDARSEPDGGESGVAVSRSSG